MVRGCSQIQRSDKRRKGNESKEKVKFIQRIIRFFSDHGGIILITEMSQDRDVPASPGALTVT